jgi:PAS domain S-box-containing protein
MFQCSWDAIAFMDEHGRLLRTSDSFLRLIECERTELDGMRIQDLDFWSDLGDQPDVSDAMAGGASVEGVETLFRSRSGALRSVQVSIRHIRGASHRWILFIGRDISEQKQAEAALHVSVESLLSINEQRKKLLAHLVSAYDEERQQVSGKIDDDTIRAISSVSMSLSLLRRSLADPDHLRQITRTEARVKTALSRLRNLAFDLRPPALTTTGLADAIGEFLATRVTMAGLEWTVENRMSRQPRPETQLALYRVAQEALANVLKHAQAGRVNVLLDERDGGFVLAVADDGVGFATTSQGDVPPHLGIACMNERAELAGGHCRLESLPGGGTSVECWIPWADWALNPKEEGQRDSAGKGTPDVLRSIWRRAE